MWGSIKGQTHKEMWVKAMSWESATDLDGMTNNSRSLGHVVLVVRR